MDTFDRLHERQLQAWARGFRPVEAATELLIRSGLADKSRPWVVPHGWIKPEQIIAHLQRHPADEQAIGAIAASLYGIRPVDLRIVMPALSSGQRRLVLAVLDYAAGGTDHIETSLDVN